MEWSEPPDGPWDDAWDVSGADADRGDPDRAESATGYPRAPLPAHERAWRHPSEMGHQAWVASEPPIVLGRGLLATAGVIGCVLGLAVLWLVVPLTTSDPTGEPTAMRSTNTVVPPGVGARPVSTSPITTAAREELVNPSATSSSVLDSSQLTDADPAGTATVPVNSEPSNTVLLRSRTATPTADSVAVKVGSSPLLITTAKAVGSESHLDVMLESGTMASAEVVVRGDTLAYLVPAGAEAQDVADTTTGFGSAATATLGETLYALSDEPVPFIYEGGAVVASLDGQDVAEGTPVVDDTGALVALCTHGELGVSLVVLPADVPTADLSATTTSDPATTSLPDPAAGGESATSTSAPPTDNAPAAGSGTETTTASITLPPSTTPRESAPPATAAPTVPVSARGWLGIRVSAGSSAGAATVGIVEVNPSSPAAAAGLAAGDVLWAIDGQQLSTVEQLSEALSRHRAGDQVVLTIIRSSTSPVGGNGPGGAAAVMQTASTTIAPSGTVSTSGSSVGSTTTSTTTSTGPAGSGQGAPSTSGVPSTSSAPGATTLLTAPPAGSAETFDLSVVLGEHGPSV